MIKYKSFFLFILILIIYIYYFAIIIFRINLKIFTKPNSGGLGNKLFGLSSSLLLSLLCCRHLIGIY